MPEHEVVANHLPAGMLTNSGGMWSQRAPCRTEGGLYAHLRYIGGGRERYRTSGYVVVFCEGRALGGWVSVCVRAKETRALFSLPPEISTESQSENGSDPYRRFPVQG